MRTKCAIDGCTFKPFSSEFTAGHGSLCKTHHKLFAEASAQVSPMWRKILDELKENFRKNAEEKRIRKLRDTD